jgi:type IV secretion system protein VirD4
MAGKKKSGGTAQNKKRELPTLEAYGDWLLAGYTQSDSPTTLGFGRERGSDLIPANDPIWLTGEGHMVTIAATGAGKGRGGLIPNLLVYGGPAIVIDPKGEACRITARARREMGQTVHVLDPFGIVGEETDSLNPFDAFDLEGVDASALAMDLAQMLSGGATSLKEPFWDLRGHDLVAGVISAVASTKSPSERNFASVRKLLKSDDVVYNLAVMLDTVGGKLHRFAKEEISSFLQTEDRCRSGILATGCSYLSVIGSDAAQRTIQTSTIDLDAVRRGDPMTIYLVVPPSQLESHAALFRLWMSVLMNAIMSRKGQIPKLRTLFAIDETAQLGAFKLLPKAFTLSRAYGMRVWAFFQDLSQLQRMIPDEWSTVVTSSAALQVFGVNNHLMARSLADIMGDFSAEELRAMDASTLALQVARQRGQRARLPDYLNDPMFTGRFDPHPMIAANSNDDPENKKTKR